jgi:hypothetical protein
MKVDDTAQNAERCVCPTCPTYNGCMSDKPELLYCARGKSGCAPTAAGCKCGGCSVWGKYNLGAYFFCMQRAAV